MEHNEFISFLKDFIKQQEEMSKYLEDNIERLKRLSESYKSDTDSN